MNEVMQKAFAVAHGAFISLAYAWQHSLTPLTCVTINRVKEQ